MKGTHRCLWKEFCLRRVLIWMLEEQDETLWLTPLFCTRCLWGSFQSKRFSLLEGVWKKSRFHSFLGFGGFYSPIHCVKIWDLLKFHFSGESGSLQQQNKDLQINAVLPPDHWFPSRKDTPTQRPLSPESSRNTQTPLSPWGCVSLKNDGRMSPSDFPKVCQESLTPWDAPPSISLVRMLGDS